MGVPSVVKPSRTATLTRNSAVELACGQALARQLDAAHLVSARLRRR